MGKIIIILIMLMSVACAGQSISRLPTPIPTPIPTPTPDYTPGANIEVIVTKPVEKREVRTDLSRAITKETLFLDKIEKLIDQLVYNGDKDCVIESLGVACLTVRDDGDSFENILAMAEVGSDVALMWTIIGRFSTNEGEGMLMVVDVDTGKVVETAHVIDSLYILVEEQVDYINANWPNLRNNWLRNFD